MVSHEVLKRQEEEPDYWKPLIGTWTYRQRLTAVKNQNQLQRMVKFQEAVEPNMDGDSWRSPGHAISEYALWCVDYFELKAHGKTSAWGCLGLHTQNKSAASVYRHLQLSRENCWKGRHQASPPEWNVVFSWNKSLWWYLRGIPSKSTCSLQLWNKPLRRNALIFEAFVVGSWPLWLNQQLMLGLVLRDVKLPKLNQCGIWDLKKFF